MGVLYQPDRSVGRQMGPNHHESASAASVVTSATARAFLPDQSDNHCSHDGQQGQQRQHRNSVHASAAPNQDRGQHHDGDCQQPQISLHATTLHARQQPAATGQFFAALVEAAIHDVRIEEPIQLRPPAENQRNPGHNPAPNPAIEPVGNLRPPVRRTQSPSRRKAHQYKTCRAAQPTPAALPSPAHPALRPSATCCRKATSPSRGRASTTTVDDHHQRDAELRLAESCQLKRSSRVLQESCGTTATPAFQSLPSATAKNARIASGIVMTRGLSCACPCPRHVPKNT